MLYCEGIVNDTHPDIEKRLIEAYRAMSPAERLRRVCSLNEALEQLARADIRRRHPTVTEREVRLRIASRRIPADLMKKAFGWDVEKEGY
jgi:hypothetical protein